MGRGDNETSTTLAREQATHLAPATIELSDSEVDQEIIGYIRQREEEIQEINMFRSKPLPQSIQPPLLEADDVVPTRRTERGNWSGIRPSQRSKSNPHYVMAKFPLQEAPESIGHMTGKKG